MLHPTDLIRQLLQSLVSYPDELTVQSTMHPAGIVFQVRCARDDLGRLIGRQGVTATAIRHVVWCMGRQSGETWTLDMGDGFIRDGVDGASSGAPAATKIERRSSPS